VTGAAVGGLSLPLLAACGSGSGAGQPSGGSQGSGGVLVPAAQVPVGGGVVLKDQDVVVTQPTKGTFEGFSAICTHQGCQVSDVASGTINCGCHGSQFAITDGANVTGPSGSAAGSIAPLPKVAVTVRGKDVVQA